MPAFLKVCTPYIALEKLPRDCLNASCVSSIPSKLIAIVSSPENARYIRMKHRLSARDAYHDPVRIIPFSNRSHDSLYKVIFEVCMVIASAAAATMQTIEVALVSHLEEQELELWMRPQLPPVFDGRAAP